MYSRLLKFWKTHLNGFGQFRPNGASPALLLLELDLHFQGQNCWHFKIVANISQTVRDRANISIAFWYEVIYLPSDGPIANDVHRYLDHIFKVTTFLKRIIFNICKTMRASKKCSSMLFIDVDTNHRITTFRMLYIVILTYSLKITQFLEIIFNVSKTVRDSEKCSSTTSVAAVLNHRMVSFRMLYIATLTNTFARSCIFKYEYLKTVRASAKCSLRLYADWCSLSNDVSPVFLPRDLYLNFHDPMLKKWKGCFEFLTLKITMKVTNFVC